VPDDVDARLLSGLNALAIDLSDAGLDTDPVPLIVDRLRLLIGALFVSYSEYDPAARALHLVRTAADGAILSRVNQILGYVIGDLNMPVPPDMYRDITSQVFHRLPDLTTLTLGAISSPLGATIEKVFGIGEKVVLIFQREGRLFGTASLLMPTDRAPLPAAALEVTTSLVSAALSRHHAERRLAESEERFRTILDAVSDGIFVHDAQTGEVLEVNARAAEMFGYTASELCALGISPLSAGCDGYTAEEGIARIRATAAGDPQLFQWRCRHRDGHLFWAEVSMRRASVAGVPRVLVVVRDITARKEAETAQERADDAANHAHRLESIGRLAGGVAHDFNNLLTAIIGNVDLAIEDLGDDHGVVPRLKDAVKAAETAASLTAQLLAFGRKQMIAPRVGSLNSVVETAAGMLTRVIGEDVTLVLRLSADAWPVRVDPMQFQQVVVNLAVNARDAMPDGGRVTLETENVVLDEDFVRSRPWASPGRFVRLSATDTGCGMSRDVLAHVFEPFYTTKPLGSGTGLGLAMVYGAVKQNHGVIEVESEVDRGTTVRIYLPAASQA
jgi:two-component system, cell cycle sensor histidine kinase and response regulator CckA